MRSAPPSPKKPKGKDIKCRHFDGTEVYPSLGAGFEYFIKEYEHSLHTETLLNGSTWTDELKASVIVNYLDGQASRYYHQKNSEWQRSHPGKNIPYDTLEVLLQAEFGCMLSHLELNDRLKCFKRAGDSRIQYLEYLKFI